MFLSKPPTNNDTKKSMKKSACREEITERRTNVIRGTTPQKQQNSGFITKIRDVMENLAVEPEKPLALIRSTVKKCRNLHDRTGVKPDRPLIRRVLFMRSEQVQRAAKAYQDTEPERPKALMMDLLNKANDGELHDGPDISPQAESLALSKQRALLQNQHVEEPDSFMAWLFHNRRSVANRAYGSALDVVLDGEAKQPLRLFSYYAKRLLIGEDISPGTGDKTEQPESESDYVGRAI